MTTHSIDTEALRATAEATIEEHGPLAWPDIPSADLLALLDALATAEHRATRAEAQSAIRGRAVVMYRERAREAEARIKAVQALHTGTRWPGVTDKPICDACDQPSPCPTIRTLDGDA